jgi:hypothetical protein
MHAPLIIRTVTASDAAAVVELGSLDRRGRVLLAEQAGVPLAALALSSGAVTADPTPDALAALRRRRYELLRQGGDVRHVSRLSRAA